MILTGRLLKAGEKTIGIEVAEMCRILILVDI